LPVRSYYIGSSTPKQNSDSYIEAISSLFRYFSQDKILSEMPLIVNTHGWVKGIGEELLKKIVSTIEPGTILQFGSSNAPRNLPANWLNQTGTFFDIVSIWNTTENENPNETSKNEELASNINLVRISEIQKPTFSLPLGPADLRNLSLMSYFDGNIQFNSNSSNFPSIPGVFSELNFNYFSLPLTHRFPYKISWDNFGVFIFGEKIDPSLCLYALNSSLVGLLADPKNSYLNLPSTITKNGVKYDIPRLFPSEPFFPCVGLGIIRSIDVEKREFHIITPIPYELLKNVNVLVKGNIDLPTDLISRRGITEGPYLSSVVAGGQGSATRKVRNNILRKNIVKS